MKSRKNVIWKKIIFFDEKNSVSEKLGSQIKFFAIYTCAYVIYEWYLSNFPSLDQSLTKDFRVECTFSISIGIVRSLDSSVSLSAVDCWSCVWFSNILSTPSINEKLCRHYFNQTRVRLRKFK